MLRPLAAAPLLLALAAAQAAAQTVWTVDANDPGADFQDLQLAVDSVADGDVLLVALASYGELFLHRPLSILGEPGTAGPVVGDVGVQSVARFELSNLRGDSLTVLHVPEPSRVDRCEFDRGGSAVVDAASLLVTRSEFSAPQFEGLGLHALGLSDSRVQFVDSEIVGGDGTASEFTAGFGGVGLAVDSSEVLLVRTSVEGGFGQDAFGPFSFDPGQGGVAVTVSGESRVEVRGTAAHRLEGGVHDFPGPGTAAAVSVWPPAGASVEVGPVTVIGALGPEVVLVGARPFLAVLGDGGAGSARTVALHGPAGGVALLALAGAPAHDAAFEPLLGLPAFLDVATVWKTLAVATAGFDQPVGPTFVVPADPSFAGLSVDLQAAVADPSGSLAGTNSDAVLLAP